MGILNRIKEIIVNKLVDGIVLTNLHTLKLVDKGNTLYVDIADFDHNASDGSPTESQMWYNSTDHVLRYRNDTETIDIEAGVVFSYVLSDTNIIYEDAEQANSTVSWTKSWEFLIGSQVTAQDIRTYFQMKTDDPGEEVQGRIYKNGGGFGTTRSTTLGTFQTYTEDLTYTANDRLGFYFRNVGTPYPDCDYRYCRIRGTIVPTTLYGFLRTYPAP